MKIKLFILTLFMIYSAGEISLAANDLVSLKFAAIQWSNRDTYKSVSRDNLYLKTNNTYQQIKPGAGAQGETQPYRGPSRAGIYKQVDTPDGRVAYRQTGVCEFPLNAKKALMFIFYNGETADSDFKAMAVNISSAKMQPGSVLFLNLSGVECAVQLRDTPKKVPFGQSWVYQSKSNTNPDLPIKVAVFNDKKQKWKKAYSSVTRISDDRSYVTVFYRAGRATAWRLKILRDLNLI